LILSIDQVLAGGDPCAALAPVAHSFKGQLLNMGEAGWADIARMVESAAKAKEVHDYALPFQAICEAMWVIMGYRVPWFCASFPIIVQLIDLSWNLVRSAFPCFTRLQFISTNSSNRSYDAISQCLFCTFLHILVS